MIQGIDTATPQRYLNFAAPIAEGYKVVYVKLGGDNVPRYVAPYYNEQVDKARYHDYERVGHYWVPSAAKDPVDAANYYVDNLRNWNPATDFVVPDNESLDGAQRYGDAALAAWISRVKARLRIPGHQVLVYSGLADARNTDWTETLATGANFIIAAYSYAPFAWEDFPSIPRSRIVGHQFGGRPFAAVPGSPVQQVVTDVNAFVDHAFDDFGEIMPLNNYVLRSPSTVILADNRDPYVSWQNHLARTGGLRGGVDLVAAVGTPVYARTAGRMLQIPNDGTAGNSCRFAHHNNGGWHDVFSHLSSYRTPKNPQGLNAFDYEAGDIVAYTGDSGWVAPHLHWHLLDPSGVRRNPWNYFSGSGTAGGGYTPIEEEDFMTDMNEFLNHKAFDNGPTISELFRDLSVVYHATFNGGPSMEDNGNPIQRSLAQINAAVQKPAAVVSLTDAQIDAIAAKVAAKIPGADAAAVAAAVRAEFKANPLS